MYTVVNKNAAVNFWQQAFENILTNFNIFCAPLTRNEFCTSQHRNVSLHHACEARYHAKSENNAF